MLQFFSNFEEDNENIAAHYCHLWLRREYVYISAEVQHMCCLEGFHLNIHNISEMWKSVIDSRFTV